MLVALFFGGVYAIGFGQAALAGRGIGAAFADGVSGTIKNVLPIVVLAAIAFVGFMVLAVGFGLLAALVAVVASFVHPVLGMLLMVPLYFALVLVMYVVMFGVMYYMWRDVCGGDSPAPASPADRFHA